MAAAPSAEEQPEFRATRGAPTAAESCAFDPRCSVAGAKGRSFRCETVLV